MKFFRRNLPVILFTCAAVFFAREWVVGARSLKESRLTKGIPSKRFVSVDRPFVVIVLGDNNQKNYRKCLRSVFEQEYGRYRVIYLDDGHACEISAFLLSEHPHVCVELVSMKNKQSCTERLYRAIHSCKDEEIVVFLDGNDWLAHEKVLEYLNYCYEDFNTWMTYGNYVEYPSYKKRKASMLSHDDKHSYRQKIGGGSILPPLRSGYAALFKKVELKDLLLEGKFIEASEEQLLFLPALEMAHHHCQHVPEILYITNTNLQKGKEQEALQASLSYRRYIKSKAPYSPISRWEKSLPKVDVVLSSNGSPIKLLATLESIEQFVKKRGKIWIVGDRPTNWESRFEQVQFVETPPSSEIAATDFFFLIDDDHIVTQRLDVAALATRCIDAGIHNMELDLSPKQEGWGLSPFIHVLESHKRPETPCIGLVAKSIFFGGNSERLILINTSGKVAPLSLPMDQLVLDAKYQEGFKLDIEALVSQGEKRDGAVSFIPR